MKVSVCIPVYKVERFVEKCARSLFEQTCDDMEFIFVDDGSPDASMEIVRRVLSEYPARAGQVRIISRDKSLGPGVSRREALMAATGEWVGFCDSDDWVDCDYYACLLDRVVRMPRAELVYAPIVREWPDGRKRLLAMPDYMLPRDLIVKACPGDGFNAMYNKIFRREIAQAANIRLAPSVKLGEDLLYVAQVVMRCDHIAYCPEVAYHYRQNPVSITGAGIGKKRPEDLRRVCEILEEELVGDDLIAVRDRLRRDVLTAAIKARVMGDPVYRAVRHRLESPLLSDPRHGLLKKTLLWLADLVYWR